MTTNCESNEQHTQRISTGSYRLQRTNNEVILEIWNGARKLSIYMDIAYDETGKRTEIDIYRVHGKQVESAQDSIVESFRWLAENGNPAT